MKIIIFNRWAHYLNIMDCLFCTGKHWLFKNFPLPLPKVIDWEQVVLFKSNGVVLAEQLKSINILKPFHIWDPLNQIDTRIKLIQFQDHFFAVDNIYADRMVSACVADCF
jgi:hypothetical protein